MRASGHDDLVALLFAQAEFAEHAALVLGALRTAQRRAGFRRRGAAARRLALLGDQLVGGEVGKIVERLDPGLAEHDQHLLVEMRDLGERILDAKLATGGTISLLALV